MHCYKSSKAHHCLNLYYLLTWTRLFQTFTLKEFLSFMHLGIFFNVAIVLDSWKS